MTPPALFALILLGAVVAPLQRKPGVLWLAAALVAWPLHYSAVGQYANARYHIPAMYIACGLAGLGIATLLRSFAGGLRHSAAAASTVTVAVVLLAALPRFDVLQRLWTPQREYDLFRDGLRRIDPRCRVVTLADTSDAGFVPFGYLVANGLLDIPDLPARLPAGSCFVYYRCGNCYTKDLVPEGERAQFEINPACRRVEERFQLEPIIETQAAALPYRGEVYARDPLPLGFYRLRERASVADTEAAQQRPD